MTEQRLLTVGTINAGTTPINANVVTLGSDVPVRVTLTAAYSILCPPGFPARPSMTGANALNLNYPRTINSGTTLALLACEANALVAAGAATLA